MVLFLLRERGDAQKENGKHENGFCSNFYWLIVLYVSRANLKKSYTTIQYIHSFGGNLYYTDPHIRTIVHVFVV